MIVLIFLIVLSVLVLIHEFGHFIAARIFGVKAEEFGYGFPPRMVGFVKDKGKWKKVGPKDETSYKNTIWSMNWLPLGGFVRIKGEGGEDKVNDPDAFQSKPIWQRILILAAGVGMNWLLAFAIFVFIFNLGAPAILQDLPAGYQVKDRSVRITNIMAGGPADKAGLLVGDQVITIAGVAPTDFEQARSQIAAQNNQAFDVKVLRDNKETDIQVQPEFIKEINKQGIGVAMADVGIVKFGFFRSLVLAAQTVYSYTKEVLFAFGGMLRDIIFLRKIDQDVSGPIGIAVMTGQVAKQGIVALLQFAAILSINLAVVNFLPIPALDGGRVLFLIIEKIRRKAVAHKIEAGIHQIAFISLIILILLVTIRDLGRYGGAIIGGLKNLVGM